MVQEIRLIAHVGTRVRREDLGMFVLFAVGAVGSEVGMIRHQDIVHGGFAIRWAP